MANKSINYVMDKETKGTFRFRPADGEDASLANATIYLPKDFVKDAKIDVAKGFRLVIEPNE